MSLHGKIQLHKHLPIVSGSHTASKVHCPHNVQYDGKLNPLIFSNILKMIQVW